MTSQNNSISDKFNAIVIKFIERHFELDGHEIKAKEFYNPEGVVTLLVNVFGFRRNEAIKIFCDWVHTKLDGPYIIEEYVLLHTPAHGG